MSLKASVKHFGTSSGSILCLPNLRKASGHPYAKTRHILSLKDWKQGRIFSVKDFLVMLGTKRLDMNRAVLQTKHS